MSYQHNKDRQVYNIDFDGTLTDGSSYEDLVPNKTMCKKVTDLYFAGHIIIIWSARFWNNANIIAAWMIQHNVPFHGLMLGKGGTDFYVDDKAIHSEDFINDDPEMLDKGTFKELPECSQSTTNAIEKVERALSRAQKYTL